MMPQRKPLISFELVGCPLEIKAMRLPHRLPWPISICFFILLLFQVVVRPAYAEKDWFEVGLTAFKTAKIWCRHQGIDHVGGSYAS